MEARQSAEATSRDPRFPATVGYKVFIRVIEGLAKASPVQRERLLAAQSENDRSQLRRAFALFGIRSEAGQYDELTLRRLADSQRRPEALRELLREHYSEDLAAIERGIDRQQLEARLASPSRNSPSSREKARQFLERAMEQAGLPTDAIHPASRRSSGSGSSTREQRSRAEPPTGRRHRQSARDRFVNQQQQYLDQLLSRHRLADDRHEAERIQDRIEEVSIRIANLLRDD